MDLLKTLSEEFSIKPANAENIISLIDGGNTIPFIARYRKEMTGSCDDQVLHEFSLRLQYLRNLDKRKKEISESIASQGKMTEELARAVENAQTLTEAEDIYRPFRPKRRTRATIAEEKGLRPLAETLLRQDKKSEAPKELAAAFIDPEKGVNTLEEALTGAQDIIAEIISDDAETRKKLRALMKKDGSVQSKAAKKQNPVYQMYYDYAEPVSKIPGHRILAINRGEREEALKVSILLNEAGALSIVNAAFVKDEAPASSIVKDAGKDAWERLIYPSVEREVRSELTEKAVSQAINLFAMNLRPLLLTPPLKGRVTLGLDPAYRTGCKIAVVDETGKVLDTTVVYPTPPQSKTEEAKKELTRLINKHGVTAISIGNGTASKESEIFVAELIKELGAPVGYMMVNEAGASVYSASKLAASEFPDFDVSLRSAVSIARRLQDPLAELVKIDPKSIGVGQYQHDMPQSSLDEALGAVVESCVNSVGVDLNTASASLLSYVSGLNSSVAKNIVAYREENGGYKSRAELKKVPKLGPKAFEQCAGFLRIPFGSNILDNTSVHPESYPAAEKLLRLLGLTLQDVKTSGPEILSERFSRLNEKKAAEECSVGVLTLRDIIGELKRPGRDIREELKAPVLRTDVMDLNDLKPGMKLSGTVRNVIDFGVFVDIGVHQDGLVHISEMSDRYIKHPTEVCKVGDSVTVTVLSVDPALKRISLSMKNKD